MHCEFKMAALLLKRAIERRGGGGLISCVLDAKCKV